MRAQRFFLLGLALGLPVGGLGCNGDDLSGPVPGSLDIIATTVGVQPDPDGYTVQIDQGQPLPIASNASIQNSGLASGNHTVMLGGVTSNCTVSGDNPRSVSVDAGSTRFVTFLVTCSTPLRALEITITTTGESLDPDGFFLTVDGAARFTGINASMTVSAPAAEPHTITLTDVASNCTAAEGTSQTVTASDGGPAAVRFTLVCSFIGITIWNRIPLPPSVTAVIRWNGGRALWGTSVSDLFILGQTSEPAPRYGIWHYDGANWTEQVSRVDTVLNGIWGFSSTDVYAVGTGGAGPPGVILHYDGSHWSDEPVPVFDEAALFTFFSGIWGPAPQDIFLGGQTYTGLPRSELLAHFDGHAWSRMTTPDFGYLTRFTDIAGTSGTDVWAIGSYADACDDCIHSTAIIAHFDGQEWTNTFAAHVEDYHGVWATAPNDAWVVGENDETYAIVLHYDGLSWTRAKPVSTSEDELQDVWASSGSDVYAVGTTALLHYDGHSWTKISDEGGGRVWGVSRHDVFILRPDEILHGTP
jgi:hypothetical protein